MDIKEIHGVAFGYEFTREEFQVLARNLVRFAHAGVSAEIRANSPNTIFGRKVHQYASTRHARSERYGITEQRNGLDRIRYERDQVRALLESDAPFNKDRDTNVVLGMFTTQVAFKELEEPIIKFSPELYEAEKLLELHTAYLTSIAELPSTS